MFPEDLTEKNRENIKQFQTFGCPTRPAMTSQRTRDNYNFTILICRENINKLVQLNNTTEEISLTIL